MADKGPSDPSPRNEAGRWKKRKISKSLTMTGELQRSDGQMEESCGAGAKDDEKFTDSCEVSANNGATYRG